MRTHEMTKRFAAVVLGTMLLGGSMVAQGYGQRNDDHRNDNNRYDNNNRNDNRGYDNRGGDHRGPQGQPNFHFRGDNDRAQFQQYYGRDLRRWRNNNHRANFAVGQAIPRNYVIQAVPQNYYRNVPPPPPGYRYGYSNGYVVAYNPTTRIVADVLDLVAGFAGR